MSAVKTRNMSTITDIVRPYASMFRIQFIGQLQYRAAAWAGIVTQFFFGFVFVMMYSAFYGGEAGAVGVPSLQTIISYQWLKQAFLMMVVLWSQDADLLNQIVGGHVAYSLCRPVDLYSLWAARLLANRAARCALRFAPVLILAFVLPAPYGMIPPPNVESGLLFIVSLLLGALVAVGMSMFLYVLTFVTLSSVGPRLFIGAIADFATGMIIPIPLMPDWLQRALAMTPFPHIADLPFRIYSGDIAGAAAGAAIGVQVFWVITLGITGWLAFRVVLRRTVVQGG
ncbi:MAG: ABC transporter permease [Oscillospiraceae bacterium]|jgi:ABC-2 type transport system permease protein|nr:ABC transporter permease [Oscillospiraceae bacterium]